MKPLAQPRTQTVALGRTSVVVRVWGDANSQPLLYWHALNPFGALEAIEVAPRWAEGGFYVIAPSAPGCGESPRVADEDYRPSRLAQLAADLLDVLNVSQAVFVGASWGASVGLHLAAAEPARVRRLVLLDGGYLEVRDDPSLARKSLRQIKEMFAGQHASFAFADEQVFIAAMRARYRRWSSALELRLLAGMRDEGGKLVPAADSEAAAAAMFGLKEEANAEILPLIASAEVPVLLMLSQASLEEEESVRALGAFRSAIPSLSTELIDAGHDLMADAPDHVAAAVLGWLAD